MMCTMLSCDGQGIWGVPGVQYGDRHIGDMTVLVQKQEFNVTDKLVLTGHFLSKLCG